MEEAVKMKKHVTIVAVIHIAFSIFGLLIALFAYFGLDFARSFIPQDEIPAAVMKFVSLLFTVVPIIIGFSALFGLIGGIGLLSQQGWARYIIIIVAALGMLNIPIGTLVGVYSLWVLLQEETIKLFERK